MTARLIAAAMVLSPLSVAAQAPTGAPAAAPALSTRIAELVPLLDGRGDYDRFFSAGFRQAVPRAQFDPIVAQLKQALGTPQRIVSTVPASVSAATVLVGYERGTATMELSVDGAGAVNGLRVTGTAASEADDSAAKLSDAFRALPGRAAYGIYDLTGDTVAPVVELNGGTAMPLGSAFKLWILGTLSDDIAAGRRRWSDVVTLAPASLPSGITQNWPAGTPITLQAAAALMISLSDNTATDTLLAAAGRERVGAWARATGADPRSLPVLGTREAFVLKADPARATAWGKADAAARARLLADRRAWSGPIDAGMFADKPVAVDAVEWFASPTAMARTLARLSRADETTRALLSISKGTDAATAARFGYLGYKGGSEPGVVSMSFLLRTTAGQWRAVTGSWYNPAGEAPALTMLTLMNRALALAAK